MPGSHSHCHEINLLRINHYIHDIPWSHWLLGTQHKTTTLDGPFLAVNFDGIQPASFPLLDQDNSSYPAVPALLAATEKSGFQADRLGRDGRNHPLTDGKSMIMFERPSYTEIGTISDFDPDTGSHKSYILRLDEACDPVDDSPVGADTALVNGYFSQQDLIQFLSPMSVS